MKNRPHAIHRQTAISQNAIHSQTAKAGFTLVEILIVILMITTLSVAGFSAIVKLGDSATVREIEITMTNMINQARSLALNGKAIELQCGNEKQFADQYGVEFKLIGMIQRLQNVADRKGCKQTTVSEEYKIKNSYEVQTQINAAAKTKNSFTLFYKAPFGDFSVKDLDVKKTDQFNIHMYKKTDLKKPLKTVILYGNMGIPETQ